MADTKLRIMLEVVDKASAKFRQANANMQKGFGKFTSFVKTHWIAIAAAITATVVVLTKFTKSVVKAADKVEQYNTRMKVLLGSVKEGTKVFEDMSELAGNVPKTYDEIMASATDLAAVVQDGSNEIKSLMPIIVDLSAGTGMAVREVTGQMIRMYSAGAAAADMFRERGVSAALGFQSGVQYSVAETMDTITKQWEDGTGKFVGASKELAKTWTGQMSMMQDAWFKFKSEVGKIIIESPAVQTAIRNITETLNDLFDTLKHQREGQTLGMQSIFGPLEKGDAIASIRTEFEWWTDELREWIEMMNKADNSYTRYVASIRVSKAAEHVKELRKELEGLGEALSKGGEDGGEIPFFKQFNEEFPKLMKQIPTVGKAAADLVYQQVNFLADGIGDAMSQMIMEGENFGDSMNKVFKNMAKNFIAYVTSMIIKWLAFAALKAAFGILTGGVGFLMHKGGAVRAHSGMAVGGDEVPIIAQTGEGILSRRGMAALGGVGALNRLNSGSSGGTNVSIVMENVSFRSEDDVEDVMERLSDLISVKTRSRV